MDRKEVYEKLNILVNHEEKLEDVLGDIDEALNNAYILLNTIIDYTCDLMSEFESDEKRIEKLKAWKDKYTDFYGGVPK